MTLSIDDVINNIAEAIQGMDGYAIAQLHNAICANKIEYKEDGIFEDLASAELIQFLKGRNWSVESYFDSSLETQCFCVNTPEGESWEGYGSEAYAWADILRQDAHLAMEWDRVRQ